MSKQEVEKGLQVEDKFGKVQDKVRKVVKLLNDGHTYNSPELYQAALNLFSEVKDFTILLENLDDNMEPDKTLLSSVDKLFEPSPILDFIEARIDYATNPNDSVVRERLIKAARAAKDYQEGKGEVEDKGEYSDEPQVDRMLDDFVEDVLVAANIKDEFIDTFRGELKKAIEILQEKSGYSRFILPKQACIDEAAEGTVTVSNGLVKVVLNGEEFYHSLPYEDRENDEYEDDGDYEVEGCFMCGSTEPCESCKQDFNTEENSLDEGKYRPAILDRVMQVDEEVTCQTNATMDAIEFFLRNKQSFDEYDCKLLRFYFSNLPFMSRAEVSMMTNNQLIIAWKQREYMRQDKE